MTVFLLKIVALLAMVIDHVAEVFGWEGWNLFSFNSTVLRYVGRVSFPIFAFCIINGWIHTHDRRKYFSRLMLCALASQIPFSLSFYIVNTSVISSDETAFDFRFMPVFIFIALICTFAYWWFSFCRNVTGSVVIFFLACLIPAFRLKIEYIWLLSGDLNVLYTLAIGVAIIFIIEKIRSNELCSWEYMILIVVAILAILAYGTNADYGVGLMGLVLIVALYFTRSQKKIQSITIVVWGGIYYGFILQNWGNVFATIIPALLILLYNQKKGMSNKFAKKLFYVFYPMHLFVIGIINVLIRLSIVDVF